MQAYAWTLAVLIAAGSVGCSRETPDQEQTQQPSARAQGKLPEDNVFSDQLRTLDKARDVQNTLDAAAAKERQQLERQEQP